MDLLHPETLIALVTLIALELVLGVDNVIFISILAGKLPEAQRARARTVGISLAGSSPVFCFYSRCHTLQTLHSP